MNECIADEKWVDVTPQVEVLSPDLRGQGTLRHDGKVLAWICPHDDYKIEFDFSTHTMTVLRKQGDEALNDDNRTDVV